MGWTSLVQQSLSSTGFRPIVLLAALLLPRIRLPVFLYSHHQAMGRPRFYVLHADADYCSNGLLRSCWRCAVWNKAGGHALQSIISTPGGSVTRV